MKAVVGLGHFCILLPEPHLLAQLGREHTAPWSISSTKTQAEDSLYPGPRPGWLVATGFSAWDWGAHRAWVRHKENQRFQGQRSTKTWRAGRLCRGGHPTTRDLPGPRAPQLCFISATWGLESRVQDTWAAEENKQGFTDHSGSSSLSCVSAASTFLQSRWQEPQQDLIHGKSPGQATLHRMQMLFNHLCLRKTRTMMEPA